MAPYSVADGTVAGGSPQVSALSTKDLPERRVRPGDGASLMSWRGRTV